MAQRGQRDAAGRRGRPRGRGGRALVAAALTVTAVAGTAGWAVAHQQPAITGPPPGAAAWRADTSLGRQLPDPASASPTAVAHFFAGLGAAERQSLVVHHPLVVGNLDGAPVELRYAANARALRVERDRERARATDGALTGQGRKWAAERAAEYTALLSGDRQILAFDPRDRGQLVEVFGDLTTARRTAVIVPGSDIDLGSYATSEAADSARTANTLGTTKAATAAAIAAGMARTPKAAVTASTPAVPARAASPGRTTTRRAPAHPPTAQAPAPQAPATRAARTHGAKPHPTAAYDARTPVGMARALRGELARQAPGTGTAVISWTGYSTPLGLGLDAATGRLAAAGAPRLDRFLAGLAAADGAPTAPPAVLCHSYGSVVCGRAAHRFGAAVADLVVLGSPGVRAEHAADLGTRARVWAARDGADWIGRVPHVQLFGLGHGADPAAADFGARRLSTAGVNDHAEYFLPGTESLRNLARITLGDLTAVRCAVTADSPPAAVSECVDDLR